ncbi:hypothetical protein [Streptomyces yaizuensis]|uniref:Uncharacterized protein n=1 Tax=Streptomyces yaizuensis TaxID=2989713 RepID=A0AA86MG79_9ACTN|nr:hypothetical protein [Streptomyces sp. YSPA8]BDT39579.1 hypothetical protein SYYSPA8_37305 [Streptomyces sp. YSPA8]
MTTNHIKNAELAVDLYIAKSAAWRDGTVKAMTHALNETGLMTHALYQDHIDAVACAGAWQTVQDTITLLSKRDPGADDIYERAVNARKIAFSTDLLAGEAPPSTSALFNESERRRREMQRRVIRELEVCADMFALIRENTKKPTA